MIRLAYSPGALRAAARADRTMFGIHAAALRRGVIPVVSAMSLLDARSNTQGAPRLDWLLAGVDIISLDEGAAKRIADRRQEDRAPLGLLAAEDLLDDTSDERAIVVAPSETKSLRLGPGVGRLVLP